jgi:cytochrome P450 family 4
LVVLYKSRAFSNNPSKSSGDKLLPEGDTVMLFIFGIHREEKYFEDPEKFYPERFDSRDGKLPYGYIPFSAGPRNCIGDIFSRVDRSW